MGNEMTLSEALKGTPSESFVKMVRLELQDIRNSFFSIGFRLYEAQQFKYYESLGYATLEDLAEAEFGFKRSTTYGLISVFRRFSTRNEHGAPLKELDSNYNGYSYSQLLEMQKIGLPGALLYRIIPSTASVRNISEYVRSVNKDGYIEGYESWKEKQEKKKEILLLAENSDQVELDLSVMTEIQEEDPVQTPSEDSNYQFETRTGVRKFLNDYYNWKDFGFASHGQKQYRFVFKNGMSLWALEVRTHPKKEDLSFIRKVVYYYLDLDDKQGPIKLSKCAIELFCRENHANL